MKKLITLLMAMALCVSMLAACGGGTSSAPAASTPESTPAASTPAESTPAESTPAGGSAEGMQVAAIFGGAINDGNWNETQYNGLKNIEAMGATIKYNENVSDTDAAEAARSYASMGFDVVYLTTNSYQDYCMEVATEFPDTMFIQINGTALADNFISVRIADEEQGFLQGALAALLSESGKVGFVGGQEINPIILGSTGFQQGVDYVNEKYGLSVEAVRQNTGDFTDVNRAKETAITMIEGGADVVCPMANDASVGVMEAAEEKGAMAIAPGLGQDASAPTATQTIVVKDVSIAFDATFAAFLAGTLNASEVETYGANKGVVYMTDWLSADVSDEVKTRAAEVVADLQGGTVTIDLTV